MSKRFAPRPAELFDCNGMPTRLKGHAGPIKVREMLTDEELVHLRGHLVAKSTSPFAADKAEAAAKLPKLEAIMKDRGVAF